VLLPLEDLTSLFKALSDPTRLRLVNVLRVQSLCVGDLQVVLSLSQPMISRHLAVLRSTKLVRAERLGSRICYSLSRAPFLSYPLGRFLSEVGPFFPELAADNEKLADYKGDSLSCLESEEETARAG